MKLSRVRTELAEQLGRIDGLQVFRYPAKRITPPSGVIGWPDPVDYDQTIARGMDALTFPVLVAVGDLDAAASADALDVYLDGAGPFSVRAALDGGRDKYRACDSVIVASARVEPISVAGIPYLAAIFDVEVTGTGGA